MKNLLTCLLAMLGLTTACGQENFENMDVEGFATLVKQADVLILDVRTAEEYAEGHIEGAILIDQKKDDFESLAKQQLTKDKRIAIYCRSGRRSANTAGRLAAIGYKCTNLKGGIIAWQEAKMPVTKDTYEIDTFKTKGGKTVKMYALTHASIRIVYDGKEIEVDPVTKLGNKTIDYTAMPKADYILITHEHGDHLDKKAIEQLTSQSTQLITNRRCADILGKGDVMHNGDRMAIGSDINLEATPAYNYSEGRTQFHPKDRDNGYVLTLDGLRIYIAGDTEDIEEMASIKDIDIAFMPCNQPYTMTTEQLVKAAKRVKPKVLFPYHYGQTDVSTLPTQLKSEGIDVRIRHYE